MAYYEFKASRISGEDNVLFPDEIIIDDVEEVVTHRKPKLIGSKETKIRFDAIASVTCDKHLLFADVIIETCGGLKIRSCGFSRQDANRIKDLLPK